MLFAVETFKTITAKFDIGLYCHKENLSPKAVADIVCLRNPITFGTNLTFLTVKLLFFFSRKTLRTPKHDLLSERGGPGGCSHFSHDICAVIYQTHIIWKKSPQFFGKIERMGLCQVNRYQTFQILLCACQVQSQKLYPKSSMSYTLTAFR